MGVGVSPEIFASRIQAALSGLRGVYCIADDILVIGAGDDVTEATRDHDANLVALLQRCREKGIHLDRDKLQLNKQSTTFMGHQLTREGLRPDKRKIDAILRPENKAALIVIIVIIKFL